MHENRKIRVAMVGAGGRAMSVIYPALADMADVEIAAICDIDKARLDTAASMYNVARKYGDNVYDYRRMIIEVKPDAVFVIGQPNIAYDLWQWCLEQGLNLYIEKPMGLSIHQARSLTWLAQKNNCVTQVSFQRRYTPMVVKLREECLKRGPIVHAVCRFYKCLPQPQLDARDHMMDDTVHSIDTLRWICGGEVIKIECHVKRVLVPDINFISATLHFDNSSTGYLINSWSSGKRVFEVEMHAPGIYVQAEHENKGHLYADGDVKGIEYDTCDAAGSTALHVFTGVSAAVRDFIDCLKNGNQPSCSFASSVKTMEVADIILAQALLEGK